MLALMPVAGVAAPQQKADITKPTRERVNKDKDQKATGNKQTSSTSKKDEKAAATTKKDNKPTTAPKKEEKPAATPKKEEKTAAPKKEEKPAAAAAAALSSGTNNDKTKDVKPAQDTANKTNPTPPKPPKPPVNTETAKFDGIDVSKYQGTINWGELKNNTKIKFVYIKATEGSDYVDPRYHENIRNAKRNGFKVGSYHFLSATSSARTQFLNFVRTAKREDQDLIPVIDVEKIKPWTPQQLRDSLMVFANLLEDYYGCKPLIYASEKFYTNYLGRAFAGYPLFIAKYSTTQPDINYKWVLWQFSERGYFKAVKGNNGLVDLSKFNDACGINDIIYKPANHKPKASVMDAVDHKEKPATINATAEPKPTPKPSARQIEEEKKKVEREARAKERKKKQAQEEADKKAKEKAEADKKAKQKAEHQKREKARQDAAQKAADDKAKRKAEAQKAAEAKRKAEAQKAADEKAQRKAAAQKARDEKAKQNAAKSTSKSAKTTSMRGALSQSQRNDSIRAAKQSGRKINKSSADND